MEFEQMFDQVKKARERAYVPYSNFEVGALLITKDGKVFDGCNIENVSYGLTNCAERTAIFKAVSEGYKEFKTLVVIADTEAPCSPCGACRQVITEFCDPKMEVIMTNLKGDVLIKTVEELLPGYFKKSDM